MGKPVTNETLRKVWDAFQRACSKDPATTPEVFIVEDDELERIVVTKGTLQFGLEDGILECEIIPQLQYDGEEWEARAKDFIEAFTDAFGISHGKGHLLEYLLKDGFVGYGNGIAMVFNPLTAAVGELDEF